MGNALESDKAKELCAELNVAELKQHMLEVGKIPRKIIDCLTLQQVKNNVLDKTE